MLHNFTYKLKVNLTNKKKCLLRGNYSKSTPDAVNRLTGHVGQAKCVRTSRYVD